VPQKNDDMALGRAGGSGALIPIFSFFQTDTSDTVSHEIVTYQGDYRSARLGSNSLVSQYKRGYYHSSAGFTTTCR
jgi:hypothetical protein